LPDVFRNEVFGEKKLELQRIKEANLPNKSLLNICRAYFIKLGKLAAMF
jgi:hypothetical protein